MSSESDDQVSRILRIVGRLGEAVAISMIAEGQATNWDMTMAIEIVASMNRRQIGDMGVSREEFDIAAKAAIEMAGVIYQESGMGKAVSAAREQNAMLQKDEGFTDSQWAAASNFASAMIAEAMRKK